MPGSIAGIFDISRLPITMRRRRLPAYISLGRLLSAVIRLFWLTVAEALYCSSRFIDDAFALPICRRRYAEAGNCRRDAAGEIASRRFLRRLGLARISTRVAIYGPALRASFVKAYYIRSLKRGCASVFFVYEGHYSASLKAWSRQLDARD